jgi:RND family efflux transporter MFP subunit
MNAHTDDSRLWGEKLRSLALPGEEIPTVMAQRAMPEGINRRRRRWPWLALLLVGAAVAGGAVLALHPELRTQLLAFGPGARPEPAPAAVTPVAAATAAPAAVAPAAAQDVVGSGHVIALRTASLAPTETARIVAIAVDTGDRVKAGDVLVRLDDAATRIELHDAEVANSNAKAALQLARVNYAEAQDTMQRQNKLYAKNVIAEASLRTAKFANDRAKQNVAIAEQDLAKTEVGLARVRHALSELTLTAPFSGIVSERTAQLGEIAISAADGGKLDSALVTVTDLSQLVIDVNIAESSLSQVTAGMSGEAVLDGYPGQAFPVSVAKIAPTASSERGTVTLRLALKDPPEGIRPNMAARVTLFASPHDAAIATNTGIQ